MSSVIYYRNRRTTTLNLFDKYNPALAKTSPLFKSDLETTLSRSVSPSCLDRKRDEAKQCTVYAWRTHCNHSVVADGILKRVIGSFNPFCDEDKDSLTEQTDPCANPPNAQPESKSTAGERNGVVPYLLFVVLFITLNLYLNDLMII